jgi:cellobiose phosphorylase
LKIAPVIPEDWTGFKVTRIFRKSTYSIKVTRKGSGNAVSLVVDGNPIEGNIIPITQEEPGKITVEAYLGE